MLSCLVEYFVDTYMTEKHQNSESLLSNDRIQDQGDPQPPHENQGFTPKRKKLALVGTVTAISVIVLIVILNLPSDEALVEKSPTAIRLALPTDWKIIPITLGRSRVAEVLFYSGHDDRRTDDYKTATDRQLIWTVSPAGIIEVDSYGRIDTLKEGRALLKVQSVSNSDATDARWIEVLPFHPPKINRTMGLPKRVVNYAGTPTQPNIVLQKIVTKYKKSEVQQNPDIPDSIKKVSADPANPDVEKITSFTQLGGVILWQIVAYADQSGNSYLKRTSKEETAHERDKQMRLIGDRYLPEDGLSCISIADDLGFGAWTVGISGDVSLIKMQKMTHREKATRMVRETQKFVMRHGLASDSQLINGKWMPAISDNDGLWTSMYAAGQFMRYDNLRSRKVSENEIEQARESAFNSLKAVLLISNIAGRDKVFPARVRRLDNTRVGKGAFLSKQFLKKDKLFAIDNYPSSPADGVGFFGRDAGQTIDGGYYGGQKRYTYNSINPQDWSTDPIQDIPATTKRTLNGYIARSFVIPELDGPPPGGLFFRHNIDGTQKVLSDAHILYDYQQTQQPILDLGNLPLPDLLKDFLNINGTQYEKADLIYKGDTSTDEVIGHLFLYKIAFDVLKEDILRELELRELISSTMERFCNCLLDNGYAMVDATGQGTKWAKLMRDFMVSDYTLEDAPIKSIQLLLSFKLCAYVTGDSKWEDEYRFLIEDSAHRYLDLITLVWKRWSWRAYNEDYIPEEKLYHLNVSQKYSDEEFIRHIMYGINYSDEEESMLAFYLIFQLQSNETYLEKYRIALEGWWNSISRSENPLWYYIYQLAYPHKIDLTDHFENKALDIAAWQLSRHSPSARRGKGYIEGSRDDVILEGTDPLLSVNPKLKIGSRKQISDGEWAKRQLSKRVYPDFDQNSIYEIKVLPPDERNIHKFNGASFQNPGAGNYNEMEAATVFTLPYWMGIYHNMLLPD